MDFLLNSDSNLWGLFQKDTKTSLPLKSLHISVQIIHNISRVRYTQTYQNNTNSLLETEFFFPISPDACFDSFEAKFNDVTIKGIIKEKEKAKQQYNEAVEAGNIAAYSEINKETGDLMKVLIGNIPPSSEVSATYSYIEKMEVSLNKFWSFRLFSCFTPRYNGDLNEYLKRDIALLASYPTITKSESYPWTIEVEIQSPSQIQFLQSPSHKILAKYGNEKHTCTIALDPTQNYKPNKDFVLLYSNGKENEVDYVMTPFENEDYCAMVTMIADFNKPGAAEAYDNFVKAKQPEASYDMDSIRGEYIFLIDRSGSMGGERIKMAKSSLQLFLKSLPQDSYYNVVSFGDNYTFLHPSSQKYSEATLTKTSKLVEGFNADMGGTEIYWALKKVYDSASLKGYPMFVFLLTDGDVSNTQKVLQLIGENSTKIRTFTIGIGNGCSAELIKKGALYGRGKHEFVQHNKDIYTKVISLLDASLCPNYSGLSLQSDNFDAVVKSVTPNPASIPFLLNGQQITFFLTIRKDAFAQNKKMPLELRLYDSLIQNYRSVKVVLDSDEVMKNDMVPKLAIHDMIKRLEEQKTLNISEKQVLWSDQAEISQALLELSVKCGILCKETAFFCEIAQNNDEVKTLRQVKVIVPTVLSDDYDNSESDEDEFCLGIGCLGGDDDCGGWIPSSPKKSKKKKAKQPKYDKAQACKQEEEADEDVGLGGGLFDDWDAPAKAEEKKESSPSVPSNSYLEVIMKQSFEGYWDPTDKAIQTSVLTNGKLDQVPKDLNVAGTQAEKIWLTILVLLWLEVVFQKEKQAWRLIHQKGSAWLQKQGINYELVKDLGKSAIKV